MVWRETVKDLIASEQENNNSGEWVGSFRSEEEGLKRKREAPKR